MAGSPPPKRCAIYTRKSTEDGLEQEFNSLDAQRASCEAYVMSQAGEGWAASTVRYDDGGFSGGSMERPGLKRLLADVAAGRVDIVVVYKVDRLTRSLMDFAKIVERFDAHQVSFVSVTQAFNTTSSMGRLTLNVLLSFAQFEREVTGERIRDKIALSKARGIWMGGMVPLGYDLAERRLTPNPGEAETVRLIFSTYLDLGSVNLLRDWLETAGVRSKAWTSRGGATMGGAHLSRGALFHILRNRLYVGEIEHKGRSYPGRHAPIIGAELFDEVSARLSANAVAASTRPRRTASALLAGRVFDGEGRPMSPSFSYSKTRRPYRYYIALDLQVGRKPQAQDGAITRVNGEVLERFVRDVISRVSDQPSLGVSDLPRLVQRVVLGAASTELLLNAGDMFGRAHAELALGAMTARLGAGERLVWEDKDRTTLRLALPFRFKMRGGRTQIDGGQPRASAVAPDAGLVEALKSAHRDLADLRASPFTTIDEFTLARAPDDQHRRQVSRLAFLAPDLQQRILDGTQPAGLKLRTLLKTELPLCWDDQRRWFASLSQHRA